MDLCLIYKNELKNKIWKHINPKHTIYQTEPLQPQNHTVNALYEHCFGPEKFDVPHIIRQHVKQDPNKYVVRIYVDLTESMFSFFSKQYK